MESIGVGDGPVGGRIAGVESGWFVAGRVRMACARDLEGGEEDEPVRCHHLVSAAVVGVIIVSCITKLLSVQ